jgi:hypothetical protein
MKSASLAALLPCVLLGAPTAAQTASDGGAGVAPDAAAFLDTWLGAQNGAKYEDYAAFYADDFRGIKRTEKNVRSMGRSDWLADRKKMFRPGLHVEAFAPASHASGELVILEFEQRFALGAYRDKGPKELRLRRKPGGGFAIIYEELKASQPWVLADEAPKLPALATSEGGIDVIEIEVEKTNVFHVDPDGQKTVLFHYDGDLASFRADPPRARYAYRHDTGDAITLRTDDHEREAADSEKCIPEAFVTNRPWLVGTCTKTGKAIKDPSDRVVIWDQESGRRLKEMPGCAPVAAAADDTIYFQRKTDASHIQVLRLLPAQPEATVIDTIEISEPYEGGPYDVRGIAAYDAKMATYRIYDEHEYRFYLPGRRPFFPGRESLPDAREQYDLTFSLDGHYAAYTERRWNENTYLVVVDLRTRKRTATKIFASFPLIVGSAIYFVSDPSFVRDKKRQFRHIISYALYRYDIGSGEIAEIAKFGGMVSPCQVGLWAPW